MPSEVPFEHHEDVPLSPQELFFEKDSERPQDYQGWRTILERRAYQEALQREQDRQAIDRIREKLARIFGDTNSQEELLARAQHVFSYQQQHLPQHLKTKEPSPPPFSTVFAGLLKMQELRGFHVEGTENLPSQGPFLVISNHFGGETPKLLGLLSEYPLHITSGYELNWQKSKFRAWFLKKLGMIPVKETLSNLSSQEKQMLLKRVPYRARKGYETVVQHEAEGHTAADVQFITSAVALLSHGEVVAMFPEGLFLYEGRALHRGYRGIELIAKFYKELTGQELPVVPVGISKQKIGIGAPMTLARDPENPEKTPTDIAMMHIAQLLPQEEQGVYRG